ELRRRAVRGEIDVHERRYHARLRAGDGPQGAARFQQGNPGQTHRPLQDIHHRVRRGGQMIAVPSQGRISRSLLNLNNPSTAAPAIELVDVPRRFVSREGRIVPALRNFSMRVKPGEFCAVVGPTGCGKSTTLSLITGLAEPTAGSVRIDGKPVAGID